MKPLKLQTKAQLPDPKNQYNHQGRFTCLGSCFANEIGRRLTQSQFSCCLNPLGTLFNPIALAEIATRALDGHSFEQSEFFHHQELWRHFLIQDRHAATALATSQSQANRQLAVLGQALQDSDLLVITLGTAWAYQQNNYAGPVGHNHRLPGDQFTKKLLAPEEIAKAVASLLQRLQQANPKLQVILSVSPVKHLREGLHSSNLSKSSLLLASNLITRRNPNCCYFPAYEILVDELRDYRFYAPDLAHPSPQAIDHIWRCFAQTYLTPDCRDLCHQIDSLLDSLNHRARHTDTDSYSAFKTGLHQKIQYLGSQIPSVQALEEAFEKLP